MTRLDTFKVGCFIGCCFAAISRGKGCSVAGFASISLVFLSGFKRHALFHSTILFIFHPKKRRDLPQPFLCAVLAGGWMRSRHWTLSVFYGMQEVGRVRDSTLHLLRTPPPTKIVVANAKFISFCQNKKEVNNIAVSNRLPQQNEPYISHRSCHPLLSPHIAAGRRSPHG